MQFNVFGKIFILLGIFFILIGLIINFSGSIPFLGKLPGDIFIKKEKFSFYFPITTSVLQTCNIVFFQQSFVSSTGAIAPFDFGHPWPQPFGRLSFGNRPIRFSLPNCGCAPGHSMVQLHICLPGIV